MTDDLLDRPTMHALLADGTTVCIRPVRPADHDRLRGLFEEMSPDNLRLRFFAATGVLPPCRLTAPAPRPDPVTVPCWPRRTAGWSASPSTTPRERGRRGDLHRRRRRAAPPGRGHPADRHLASTARAEGITTFTADALSENQEVLRLFADLGLHVSRRFEGPEVCTVRLDQDDAYLSAVEARGRTADVASLMPLLKPSVVAVAGAGRDRGSVGRAVLDHLRSGGFTGRLLAVNPAADSILGVPSYPSVAALPESPDLVIVAVPAAVPDVAEECGRAGVRALAVVTAGLDRTQARQLLASCRTHGMRLVGPNCLGICPGWLSPRSPPP